MNSPKQAAEGLWQPEIQQQKLVIQNYHGEKLVGILRKTFSKDVLIVCHGFQSSKDRTIMVNLATALTKEGSCTFCFDFSGNGESEGSFQYGNYHKEADDLHAVIQHFRGEGYLVSAIIGHSKGGDVVVLYASKYNDVPIVVNLSGRFNLERGMEGRLGKNFIERIKRDGFIDVYDRKGKFEFRVTEESLNDRLTTDIRAACELIHQDCRVLTVHGSKDKTVPVEDAFNFDRFIINHKLHIVDKADHGYTSHQDALKAIVLNFVASKSYLNNENSARSRF